MRWAGHVAGVRENKNAYRNLGETRRKENTFKT
jgi:hypothetical protein